MEARNRSAGELDIIIIIRKPKQIKNNKNKKLLIVRKTNITQDG